MFNGQMDWVLARRSGVQEVGQKVKSGARWRPGMRRAGAGKVWGRRAASISLAHMLRQRNTSNTSNNTGNTSRSHAPVQGSTAAVAREEAAELATVTSPVVAAGVKWLTREAAVTGEGGRRMGVLQSCLCL